MIKQGNFLLMSKDEFRPWLAEQVITRLIKGFQVHHTAFPNYITRKIVDGVGVQDKFKCLEGMRSYHLSEGWAATGQNITIFEDGMIAISLDRPLNRIPAGIKGANNGYICIENIGYFDRGNDQMQSTQREAILHVYASLCEKFKLPVNTDTIVYHAWFTNKGERLNDYIPSRSSKTCPGTYWWNDGNTVDSARKNFLPQIQNELSKLKNNTIPINTNKDDQPMTAEETKNFEALKKTVEQQTFEIENLKNSKGSLKETNLAQDTHLKKLEDRLSAIEIKEHMQVPDWAKEAVDSAVGSGLIKEPDNASYDFYRLLTVLHRKDII